MARGARAGRSRGLSSSNLGGVTAGSFIRQQAAFRGWPEAGAPPSRYHLYAALACPWSHRTVIVRKLARVDIGISYAHPYRDERGW